MKTFRIRFDKKRSMLAIALAAGIVAAWLSQRHIQARIQSIEADARTDMVTVLVAASDLARGDRLTSDSVATREVPVQWASSGTLGPGQFGQVESSRVSQALRQGEPILWAHIETARTPTLSERLSDGRRAVTIPVDEMSSVSGLLQPGDLIDLYVSFELRGKRTTVPLLQSMKVLATGQQLDSGGGATGTSETQRSFSTLTLDASPDQAVKLIAARDGGTITAMLRRPDDARPAAAASRTDLATLLGLQERAPPRISPAGVAVIYGDRPLRRIPRLGERSMPDAPDDDAGERMADTSRLDTRMLDTSTPDMPLSAAFDSGRLTGSRPPVDRSMTESPATDRPIAVRPATAGAGDPVGSRPNAGAGWQPAPADVRAPWRGRP